MHFSSFSLIPNPYPDKVSPPSDVCPTFFSVFLVVQHTQVPRPLFWTPILFFFFERSSHFSALRLLCRGYDFYRNFFFRQAPSVLPPGIHSPFLDFLSLFSLRKHSHSPQPFWGFFSFSLWVPLLNSGPSFLFEAVRLILFSQFPLDPPRFLFSFKASFSGSVYFRVFAVHTPLW